MRTVTILGATGSVGTSTLDLIEREPDKFRVRALTANNTKTNRVPVMISHLPAAAGKKRAGQTKP